MEQWAKMGKFVDTVFTKLRTEPNNFSFSISAISLRPYNFSLKQ